MKHPKWYASLPEFDRRTAMNAHFAAHHALCNVSRYFWVELPASWEDELAQSVHTAFARSQRWRKRFQSQHGPDYLRMFLRQRLTRLMFAHMRPLFRQLPDSFKWGQPLPVRSLPRLRELEAKSAAKVIQRKRRVARPATRCFVHGWELLVA